MPHDIFISYSSKRKSVAKEVCRYLEGNGLKCWMAPRNLIPGINFGNQIDDAIRNSKIVVLIFSRPASKSKWVSGEINVAFEEGKYIIPFCIDDTEMVGEYRIMLRQMHRIDAYPDYSHFLPNLLQSIQAIAEMDDKIKAHDEKLNDVSEQVKESAKQAKESQTAADMAAIKAKASALISQAKEEEDLDEKIRLLKAAIELDAENAEAFRRLGWVYNEKKEYDEAIKNLEKAIGLNLKSSRAYVNIGFAFKKVGNIDKAFDCYKKAIDLNPQSSVAHNNLGWTYYEKKEYDEAIKYLSMAINLNSQYALAYNNRSKVYKAKAKQEQDENKKAEYEQLAKADLQKAKELKEKQED